jgi:hypothetical protein
MTGLTEDDLKSLIRSPKPAFTAIGVTNDPNRDATFKVIYNGQGAWMIERPTQTELLSGERTVLRKADAVDVIDIPVAVNNDVKSALDGRRMAYLDEGTFEIIGAISVAGRSCYHVRGWGLKQGQDKPFELAVDRDVGCILRMARDEFLFEVTEFRFGQPPLD